MLAGLISSSEHLTVMRLELNPSESSRARAHGGDELLYVTEGTLHVRAWHEEQSHVFELEAGDACYLPQGTEHHYANYGVGMATAIEGVAPAYQP